jgi:hypothetical protein
MTDFFLNSAPDQSGSLPKATPTRPQRSGGSTRTKCESTGVQLKSV